jgi:transposase
MPADADTTSLDETTQELVNNAVAQACKPLLAEIHRLGDVTERAKATIRNLLRQLYGSRAETIPVIFDVEGQQVINADWLATLRLPPAEEQDSEELVKKRKPRPDPNQPLTERFPNLSVIDAEPEISAEAAALVAEGTHTLERTEEYDDDLVVEQPRRYIRRRWKYVLRKVGDTDANNAVALPLPAKIVSNGILACLTIHILVIAKFLDAIPFHRHLTAWQRLGMRLPRQTVNDAFTAWAALFKPLADTIIDSIYHDPVVHADEGWARRHDRKKCAAANLCTLVGERQVGYLYTEKTGHDRARDFIPPWFAGYLIRDGWAAWRTQLDCQHGGCNAHARRPFAAKLKVTPDDPDATRIIALYAQVYILENHASVGPADKLLQRRRRIRDEQTRPIMQQIRQEADRIAGAHPFSSDLARGARYIQNHWDDLTAFLDNPLLPPDNNAAESALRINALIRKNSLFYGSAEGGERAATALTILHSCRLAGIEPLQYLQQVTPKLLDLRERGVLQQSDLDHLMPRSIADARAAD